MADWLGLKHSQAITLMALQRIPVMDYSVVKMIDLYPPSKMRNAVLEKLYQDGWIRFHNLRPESSDLGAPRLVWSLNENRKEELDAIIEKAEMAAQKRMDEALSLSGRVQEGLKKRRLTRLG